MKTLSLLQKKKKKSHVCWSNSFVNKLKLKYNYRLYIDNKREREKTFNRPLFIYLSIYRVVRFTVK